MMSTTAITKATAAVALTTAMSAAADPIRVPQDFPTIQEAFSIAKTGDEIWVEAGEYPGFDVTVAGVSIFGDSEGGTIITGDTMIGEANGELHSLTFALKVRTFEMMVAVDCTFKDGGLQVLSSEHGPILLSGCTFTECNRGALKLLGTDAILDNCLFTQNTTEGNGAAIQMSDICTLIAADTMFTHNSAAGSAGAIEGSECGGIFLDTCTFLSNSAGTTGGAIGALAHTLSVDRCIFDSNISAGEGAAIHFQATQCFSDPGITQIKASKFSHQQGLTTVSFVPEPSANYNIENSIFCDNEAQEAIRGTWEGAGVQVDAACCLADVNRDGQVTATDFPAWLGAYEDDDLRADQNDDLEVMPNDFTSWIDNYSDGCVD